MNCLLGLLVLLVVCCSAAAQHVASLNFGVSDHGLQQAAGGLVAALESGLVGLPLPPIERVVDVPELGDVTVTVYQLRVEELTVSAYSTSILAGKGFALDVKGAHLKLAFSWSWRKNHFPHLSAAGTGVGQSEAKMAATVAMGVSGGEPTAVVSKFHVSLADFRFHLEGSWTDWLLNVFADVFGWLIKDVVQYELNNKAPAIINAKLAASLAAFPTSVTVGDLLQLYFPFYTFTATSTVLSYGVQGLGSTVGQPANLSPYTPVPLPVQLSPVTDEQVFVGEFLFNTVLWTLGNEGLLNFMVTQADLPPDERGLLNTDAWKLLVPALYRAYPNTDMVANFSLLGDAVVNFSATSMATATVPGLLGFDVVQPQGLVNAFVLSTQIVLAVNISAAPGPQGPLLYVVVQHLDVNLALYSSNIGSFSVLPLRSLVRTILAVVLPKVNKLLANGIALPSFAGLHITDAEILWGNGYFMIGSSLAKTTTNKPTNQER